MAVWKTGWIIMASIICQIEKRNGGGNGKRGEGGNLLICKINIKVI